MNFSGNVAKKITRESLIEMHGKIYQIQSLNEDYRDNKIIIRATEMTTQVNIIDPDPSSSEV
jgi:phage repressor protein C with HTH and peptisase S24 domain